MAQCLHTGSLFTRSGQSPPRDLGDVQCCWTTPGTPPCGVDFFLGHAHESHTSHLATSLLTMQTRWRFKTSRRKRRRRRLTVDHAAPNSVSRGRIRPKRLINCQTTPNGCALSQTSGTRWALPVTGTPDHAADGDTGIERISDHLDGRGRITRSLRATTGRRRLYWALAPCPWSPACCR